MCKTFLVHGRNFGRMPFLTQPMTHLTIYHLLLCLQKLTPFLKSCRRAAATICPRPGLQRKRAAAALRQAGRPSPISQYAPPADRMYATPTDIRRQTDRRQTASSLNAPWGHNIAQTVSFKLSASCNFNSVIFWYHFTA